ncbi:MAG: nucleoside 2-deoxyribosyltransferase domain-containing protein [bacterium]|nr:nucleoside 2-deoxyribosyltransferase domain-containing protein [bacterium]
MTKSKITVVYVGQEFPTSFSKALMLVGPTPRSPEVLSWRPEAIEILEHIGYDGVVFVPEREDATWRHSYDDQVETEERMLHMADCIVCWIPRDMATMPALTTNDEYGTWKGSGKVVLGTPPGAASVRYQQYYARKLSIPVHGTLEDTLQAAVDRLGDGALRSDGECHVPLYVWKTPSFQQWYQNLRRAGNRLDGARVEWVFRAGPKRSIVFFWALHVDVYIASENRHKTNEVVIARPDIATIVAYCRGTTLEDTDVVLIREFRSPVSNPYGFVYEVPGGSSFKPVDEPRQLATDEFGEETGLHIDVSRMREREARQLVATLSAHQAHLFSVELTADEVQQLRDMSGTAHGIEEDSERTYVEVKKLGEIMRVDSGVDWSMLGMILSVLHQDD